jgi:hypothetical protein
MTATDCSMFHLQGYSLALILACNPVLHQCIRVVVLTIISEQPVHEVDRDAAWRDYCGGMSFKQVSGESLKL